MASFNVVTQPWMLVLGEDGQVREVGLRDALIQAHRFRAIQDPMPTVEFGLYRLLIAFVYDIFADVRGPNALGKLLAAGRFDPVRIDAYFAGLLDRFDLFHPTHPFLQTAFEGTEKPLAGLVFPIPSGTNARHFHHAHEDEFAVSLPVATRLLTTVSPLMTAGGAGLSPSINGAPPWYVLIPGETLFETLCRNLCVVPLSRAHGPDIPAWRNDRTPGSEEKPGTSYLESLTWQPRKIQLLPGAGGVCSVTGKTVETRVARMRFAPGDNVRFEWRDPQCAYVEGKIQRPTEGRDPWRDTGPLTFLGKPGEDNPVNERPRILDQFASLMRDRHVRSDTPLDLALYGLRTDLKMKIFEWRRESLTLPMMMLWNVTAQVRASEEIGKAEEVSKLLRSAIKRAFPRDGKGNPSAYDTLVARAQRQFWNDLRDDYGHLLETLVRLDPEEQADEMDAACRAWRGLIRQTGSCALSEAIDDLDTDADAIERLVKARALFFGRMAKILD